MKDMTVASVREPGVHFHMWGLAAEDEDPEQEQGPGSGGGAGGRRGLADGDPDLDLDPERGPSGGGAAGGRRGLRQHWVQRRVQQQQQQQQQGGLGQEREGGDEGPHIQRGWAAGPPPPRPTLAEAAGQGSGTTGSSGQQPRGGGWASDDGHAGSTQQPGGVGWDGASESGLAVRYTEEAGGHEGEPPGGPRAGAAQSTGLGSSSNGSRSSRTSSSGSASGSSSLEDMLADPAAREVWLRPQPRRRRAVMLTLPTIMRRLGHEGRELDILKLDIEGAEYEVLWSLLGAQQDPGVRGEGLEILARTRVLALELHFNRVHNLHSLT